MHEPNEVLQTLTGRGTVSAEGCGTVRVRYRVIVERRASAVIAHGSLHGSHAGLRPIWLMPDSTLRLKTGRSFAISITDLVGDTGEFESTGSIGNL